MKQNSFIPDHSLEALEEAYQAALLNLAFQQIEQEEWKMMRKRIYDTSLDLQNHRFAKRLAHRLRNQRTRSFLRYKLPKVAQVAACLIAVLSIGAGVALAASREVRSWAAGVLTGSVINPEFSFGSEPLTFSITDGVEINEQLLLVESGTTLILRESMDAEPVRYEWKDRGARNLSKLAVYNDTLYVLFEDGYADDATVQQNGKEGKYKNAWTGKSFDQIGLGCVQLGEDGTFTINELAYFDGEKLFGLDVENCAVVSAAVGNEKLYFVTEYDVPETGGFSFGNRRARLFACDLAHSELVELPLPIENKDSPECELFSDGDVFLSTSTLELPVQVWQIKEDGSCTSRVVFDEGSSANSFAYCAANDTLYFQRDSILYAAAHFDVANAARVALTGGSRGKGLLIDENSYAIIDVIAEVFNLDDEIGAVKELVVGGNFSADMTQELRAQNPELTLRNDPVEYAVQRSETDDARAAYRQMLVSGEATADLVSSFYTADGTLYSAGWGKFIQDEEICAEIDLMPESVRKYVTKDGEYIAFPCDTFCAYADLGIIPAHWQDLGLGDAPQTWLELAQKLSELSHSENAGKYVIFTQSLMNFAQALTLNLTDGFARSWAARGLEMDFGGADYQAAIEAIESIDFSALRCSTGALSDDALMYLGGGIYDPFGILERESGITLRIRPEDQKISKGSCYIARINPASDAEELAYSYLHVGVFSDSGYNIRRLNYDFSTPAVELAELSDGWATAEEIETYRAQVGDVWLGSLDIGGKEQRNAVLNAYAKGEIGFDSLAEQLNSIYAGL